MGGAYTGAESLAKGWDELFTGAIQPPLKPPPIKCEDCKLN